MTTVPAPTCREVMDQLEKLGKESTRKTYIRHGAPADRIYGVAIGDLKKIQKRIKKNYELSLELFATGNGDAQYLAGLIADESKMRKSDLNKWAREAAWSMVGTYAVAGVAAESPHAVALGTKWIDSKQEKIAMLGWPTLSGYLSITPDEEIDTNLLGGLLKRVEHEIHEERNGVKDVMNQFVISVGCYVAPLSEEALRVAKAIGAVEVDHGPTRCKTPLAEDYIRKVEKMGRVGRKRKSARC